MLGANKLLNKDNSIDGIKITNGFINVNAWYECINVAFTLNYYEFNTSDTKSKTFKACFKRFDLKNKKSIIKFELL